jgi:hypothetical protein
MAMEVTEEKDVSALKCLFHHEFGMVQDWVLLAAGHLPLSVQVLTYQAASIVADDHTIGV